MIDGGDSDIGLESTVVKVIDGIPTILRPGKITPEDIIEVTESRIVPDWMEVDYEAKKGTVKELPTREAIDVPVNEMLIVELYSK